ncbi:MAG TPA: phenylalanine--tRNA ligase subunit alpha [Planctomycetota bacterium]|nr:phenylalanine--tRNA ligase subunit alpha [Planctomycetota bacterium]
MDLDAKISEVRNAFYRDMGLLSPDQLKSRYLGREGAQRELFATLKDLPAEQKGAAGQKLNAFKKELEQRYEEHLTARSIAAGQLVRQKIDLTLPGRVAELGRRHPIYRVWDEIARVFTKLGFDIVYGPEIETEANNFEALNIPLDHPARDGFDTFYIEPPHLLRSHTSPVQIRTMRERKPPIRVIAPGKVFRPDKPDAGHSPMFHQVEGLIVAPGITFAHLKGVLLLFARSMWGEKTVIRFRPSFFPFTEPSAEVDVSCFLCGAKGCPVCKGSGWVEILGSGMVHPKVLENCGIDAEANTGFAFGMGVERIAMLKYAIPDIRRFYENHFAFLRQF